MRKIWVHAENLGKIWVREGILRPFSRKLWQFVAFCVPIFAHINSFWPQNREIWVEIWVRKCETAKRNLGMPLAKDTLMPTAEGFLRRMSLLSDD